MERRPPQKAAATQTAPPTWATAWWWNWRPYMWLLKIWKTTFCRGGFRGIFDLL